MYNYWWEWLARRSGRARTVNGASDSAQESMGSAAKRDRTSPQQKMSVNKQRRRQRRLRTGDSRRYAPDEAPPSSTRFPPPNSRHLIYN
jgi:hypothetical protein